MLFTPVSRRRLTVLAMSLSLQACAVVTVADAAVTVVATGVKVAAKTVGAVVDVVIPDKSNQD
jgi:hypothetical protein